MSDPTNALPTPYQNGRVVLKPCPFCGNEEVEMLECVGTFIVCCPKCYATGPEGTTENQTIKKWNRRARE